MVENHWLKVFKQSWRREKKLRFNSFVYEGHKSWHTRYKRMSLCFLYFITIKFRPNLLTSRMLWYLIFERKSNIWGQFHQHSTCSFYVSKLRAKLICAYVLGLYSNGVSLPVQKLHVERWWNWAQVGSLGRKSSHRNQGWHLCKKWQQKTGNRNLCKGTLVQSIHMHNALSEVNDQYQKCCDNWSTLLVHLSI